MSDPANDDDPLLDSDGKPLEHERTLFVRKNKSRFIDGDTVAEFAKTLEPVKKKLVKRKPWDPK